MNEQTNTACPDSETLSAYFDKEIHLDETQLEHIKNCASCSAFLKVCTMISSAVVHTPDEVYTDDTPEHILSATKRMIIKERLDESRRKCGFTFKRWIPRIAALFILSAFMGYLLYINGYIPMAGSGADGSVNASLTAPGTFSADSIEKLLENFAKENNIPDEEWKIARTQDGLTQLKAELTGGQYAVFVELLENKGFKTDKLLKPSLTQNMSLQFIFTLE